MQRVAIAVVLLILAGCCNVPSQQRRHPALEDARWEFSEANASAAWSALNRTGPRYVAVLRPIDVDEDADTFGSLFEGPVRVSIREAAVERYAWNGFGYSVWAVDRSTLVYARFSRGIPGGWLVAVDLNSGKVIWIAPLAHPLPQGWSMWLNLITIDIRGDLVYAWSLDGGRFLEVLDLASGRSLGWRAFP